MTTIVSGPYQRRYEAFLESSPAMVSTSSASDSSERRADGFNHRTIELSLTFKPLCWATEPTTLALSGTHRVCTYTPPSDADYEHANVNAHIDECSVDVDTEELYKRWTAMIYALSMFGYMRDEEVPELDV